MATEHDDVSIPASATAALAWEPMWVHSARLSDYHIDSRLFSLRQREGAVACCMQAPQNTVQNVTISLQQNQCIVLGRAITLRNDTFKGADPLFFLYLSSFMRVFLGRVCSSARFAGVAYVT